ncbi:uncharacterized protein Z520_08262 [Fonsecaea multimorphosa CBS 102226]|uniref:Uncharacterized protein n=1 Tax=Fonsecaea multimorphosa CBS 102226 TaxID=1442371 RepID=A0A0D2JRG8_9EURO|nr:uncharacterized protein Z520_08262 [Fonsecaea multimorphosa CBS 102226]KIX96007.1 hypothetical protein Z520_08262 [Fonsecaea multimorphosa CBS 102226]OAL21776.1 hypothetical protein AYO22_07718 [Fonsecaea multimorphosa]
MAHAKWRDTRVWKRKWTLERSRFAAEYIGYSPEYVDEVLKKKREERTALNINLQRPTYLKVNRKYLHPDTLDRYGLPWEWDSHQWTNAFANLPTQTNDEFIIIKQYIDHEQQDVLFEHTRRLKEAKTHFSEPNSKPMA